MSVNLHVVLNNFINDSRVLKETKSIASKYFDKIYIAALWEDGVDENELLDSKREVWRIRLISRGLPKNLFFQVFKYFEWIIKIYIRFRKEPISVVHCHDLSALPIGALFKLLKKTKVIYDAHEFETEQVANPNRLFHLLSIKLEKYFIKKADAVITVSGSIADAYVQRYGINRPSLVLNCPPYQSVAKSNYFRKKFNINDNKKIFLFLGGLSKGRGLEILLNIFSSKERKNAVLVIMGYGDLTDQIQEMAFRFDTIYYHPAVSPDKILSYAASADIGLCLIPNSCLSYYYSLPNKLFEYAMAGLPMLMSNLAEIGRLIRGYDCGQLVDDETQDGIAKAIENMLSSDLEKYSSNSLAMARRFNWEEQEKVLLSAYRKVLSCVE